MPIQIFDGVLILAVHGFMRLFENCGSGSLGAREVPIHIFDNNGERLRSESELPG
ncbi:MAG: hypothetical protein WAL75_20345 [Terracidiphilus sp.]